MYTCGMVRSVAVPSSPSGPSRTLEPTLSLFLLAGCFVLLNPQPLLAWRDDPRPAADAPAGVESPQASPGEPVRRMSRRAQRRTARRRPPLDELQQQPRVHALPAEPRPATVYESEPDMSDRVLIEPAFSVVAPTPRPQPTGEEPAGITIHRDQAYGQSTSDQPRHGRQRFDLYLPAGCNAGGMPLVVWIPGDTWRDGSKADCPVHWLADQGYAVASIGYRLSDTAIFPAQLDDCRAAIAEIERNADVWGIDSDRVAVVGIGAGGHLAALVGLSGQAATATDTTAGRNAGTTLPRIAAVCAVSAPASLTTLGPDQDRPGSPASRLIGGPLPEFREAARRASPVTHVSADDPPVLVLHTATDRTVPQAQAFEFAAALKAAGVDHTLVVLPDGGHRPELDLGKPGGQALISFLDRVLGPGIRPESGPRP